MPVSSFIVTACYHLWSVVNSVATTNLILVSVSWQLYFAIMSRRQAPTNARNLALQSGSLFSPPARPKPFLDSSSLDEILALLKKIDNDVATIKMQLASSAQNQQAVASAPPAYTSRIYPQIRSAPYN